MLNKVRISLNNKSSIDMLQSLDNMLMSSLFWINFLFFFLIEFACVFFISMHFPHEQ